MSSLAPWQDARSRIEAANLLPAAQIEWPNEPFAQPDGLLWMSVRDRGDLYEPIGIGGNEAWQERGIIYIECNAPVNTGTVALRQLAEAAANVFRGIGPNPVVYLGGSIGSGELGAENSTWWTLPVTIEWRYDTILTT